MLYYIFLINQSNVHHQCWPLLLTTSEPTPGSPVPVGSNIETHNEEAPLPPAVINSRPAEHIVIDDDETHDDDEPDDEDDWEDVDMNEDLFSGDQAVDAPMNSGDQPLLDFFREAEGNDSEEGDDVSSDDAMNSLIEVLRDEENDSNEDEEVTNGMLGRFTGSCMTEL